MKMMDKHRILTIKGVYLCMITVYALLREVLSIQAIVGSSIITYGFFGGGMLLIVAMMAIDRKPFLHKSLWLPILFLIICGISTLVNCRFDFMSNIKAIAWMTLYFMLLLPDDGDIVLQSRNMKWLMATAVVTLIALAVISVPMYYFDVDYTYVKSAGFVNNQGFSRQYMRLWGVYIDTNTAGVYSLVGICFAGYLFIKSKNLIVRFLLGTACAVLFQFTVLTNSRTALVSLLAAAAWCGFYLGISHRKGSIGMRVVAACLVAIISVGTVYGIYAGTKFVMPYGKMAIQSVTSSSFNAGIHRAYDRLFKSSTLNVTEGYYSEQSTVTESLTTEPTSTEPVVTEPAPTVPMYNEETKPVAESLNRTDKKEDISNGRFKKWIEVLEIFRHKPILGTSPRAISSVGKQINPNSSVAKFNFAAHNSLLEVLAGTGILGFAVVFVILVRLAWIILRSVVTGKVGSELLLCSTVLLIIVCEMLFISDVFFALTFGGVAFWFSAGQVLSVARSNVKAVDKE